MVSYFAGFVWESIAIEAMDKGKRSMLLTEQECVVVEGSTEDESQISKNSLIGSLITSKPFNSHALKATMKGAWRLRKGFLFRELQQNLFIFQFASAEDVTKVMEEGPWSFDKALLVLKNPGIEQPSKIKLGKVQFWVRVYDIPFAAITKKTAKAIGECLGGFIEVNEDDFAFQGKFLRVRVQIDITKPLFRGFFIKIEDRNMRVTVMYERLPNFCYTCG